MQERAEVNQLLGIDSRVVGPDEIAQLCPQLDLSDRPTWPIVGALYHPPGGIIRHDAVVWGFARGADRAGRRDPPVHRGDRRRADRTAASPACETNRGRVEADVVISAVAGWSTLVCGLAGVRLPITTHILQAFVTEPVKPFLDAVIVSAQMHVYVSQTDRGEFLIGAEIEPYTTYKSIGHASRSSSTPRVTRSSSSRSSSASRCCATWTGLCDLSPDYSPILGATEVENFHVSAGWGTYGFKAAPIVGTTLAELVATGKTPRPDRAVHAGAVPHRHARLRAGRRGGVALAMSGVDGAVVVVTGASRGIGKDVADALAARGATVIPVARTAERFRVDVSNPEQVAALARVVEEEFGAPTILVNAAGVFGPLDRFRDTDPEAWIRTVMVDAIGPYLTCRAFVGGMIEAGWGRIVNFTSAVSLLPPDGIGSAYATAKAALNHLTRHLAADLDGTGVTANVIHPGDIKTAMWADIRDQAEALGEPAAAHARWATWVEETGGDPPEKAVDLVLRIVESDVNGRFLWIDEPLRKPLPSWDSAGP